MICVNLDLPIGDTDAEQNANACLAKWTLRNAKTNDAAASVAEGLLAACSTEIDQARGEERADNSSTLAKFRRQALFLVTNARAGKCWLPE